MSEGVSDAQCRNPSQAGRIAVMWSLGGLILFLIVAQLTRPPGESFMFDWFLWFVRFMVGGSLTFEWLQAPTPLAPAWEGIILALLAGSTLLGVLTAYHTAAQVVHSVPFCESCSKTLTPKNLWNISPLQAERTMRAFQSMKYDEIAQIPRCSLFDNFVSVDLWSCTCASRSILELVGHGVEPAKGKDDEPTEQDPVRIFSRPLNPDQTERLPA